MQAACRLEDSRFLRHDLRLARTGGATAACASERRRKTCAARPGGARQVLLLPGPRFALNPGMETVASPRILVLYFSRTGTTRKLAESIAHATRADIEGLRERRSRRGIWGWLRSAYEGTYKRASEPLPLSRDLQDYDLVFVGSPTWNDALCSPVRGFLQRYGKSLRNVALFATCAERGADAVLQEMAELIASPPKAQLAIREYEVKRSAAVQVGELVEQALVAWEKQESARPPRADAAHGLASV